MRIVALDFETANQSMASACSLGIAIYEEGEIVDNFEWYFKPYHRYNYFTNTHIHGISYEDVQDENEFVFYYEELSVILKDAVIIAHNAMFDITVLNSMCDVYGLNHFTNSYLDTVTLSRGYIRNCTIINSIRFAPICRSIFLIITASPMRWVV
ncbi:MAG: hypothetical protein IKD94_00885 [Erysipelotrichaceae bacterium]|nr:hypothetical protein [Erysipelotrichaceae bacterium]